MLQVWNHGPGPGPDGTACERPNAPSRGASRGSTSVRPWTTASGSRSCAAISAASQPGCATQSSSVKTIRSAAATRQPALRAAVPVRGQAARLRRLLAHSRGPARPGVGLLGDEPHRQGRLHRGPLAPGRAELGRPRTLAGLVAPSLADRRRRRRHRVHDEVGAPRAQRRPPSRRLPPAARRGREGPDALVGRVVRLPRADLLRLRRVRRAPARLRPRRVGQARRDRARSRRGRLARLRRSLPI